jgi:hypothetical protein
VAFLPFFIAFLWLFIAFYIIQNLFLNYFKINAFLFGYIKKAFYLCAIINEQR